MTFAHLRDDETHLQTPVAEVSVADGLVAKAPAHALERLADDGGAQVSHVQGLGDVRPAVVDDDCLRLLRALRAEASPLKTMPNL